MTEYTPLTDQDLDEAEQLFAQIVVPVMSREHAAEYNPRSGAYLGIRDTGNIEVLRIRAGTATEAQFDGYGAYINGKNDALEKNPEHRTSWEVHRGDTNRKPYPGAIRSLFNDRFAISGFSWQRDTIGCLWLARKTGRLTLQEAYKIAKICGLETDFKRLFFKLYNAAKALPETD